MKILSLLLSATLLTSTAAIASAAPKSAPRKPTIDHRFQPPRITVWQQLATLRAAGTKHTVQVRRSAGAIDDLRISVSRGAVTVRKVIVTFADGSKHTVKVGARLTAGDSKRILLPGKARRIVSIEVRHSRSPRAQLALSAR